MRRLVWYTLWYAASAALLKVGGFALFLWLARSMSVEQYGRFGLLYALQAGLATLALAGIVEVVVGSLNANTNDDGRQRLFAAANSAFLWMFVAALGICYALFHVFGAWEGEGFATFSYTLISGGLLAFATLQSQLVRLRERHAEALAFNFVVPAASLIGSFVLFSYGKTMEHFFGGAALGAGIALLLVRIIPGVSQWTFTAPQTSKILAAVPPFALIALLGWLSGYGNNYVVQVVLDEREIAKYTFALNLAATLQLVATAMNQVWSARFYKLSSEMPISQLEETNRPAFRAQAIVLGFVGAIVIGALPFGMEFLGGNLVAYSSMQGELVLLFAAYVILVPWWHCHNYFLVHGKARELLRVVLATSVVGIFIWTVLMSILGEIGIYIGFFVQMLLRVAGIVVAARRHWQLRIAWGGVTIGLVTLGAAYALSIGLAR